MLELATKQVMASHARTLAESYQLVNYQETLFIPAHWKTEHPGPCDPTDQVWLPLTRNDILSFGNNMKILFANDSEITNFVLMLRQIAERHTGRTDSILIKTEEGLRRLDDQGQLQPATGEFCPNVLPVTLVDDEEAKTEVRSVIDGWLNSEEEAESLLFHLSTALSPSWSAVKYLLFIGDGRNGKSVMLSMIADLFGVSNISNVTRQQMSERLPVVAELNNKLLNIIYDGEMTYIRDSSVEKTLIAGEPAVVRMLYENNNTTVQTNALFIEALNREPKARDKSSALQKRLSRFWFQNVYDLDLNFERHMRQPRMLGAFLALLLDHFVQKHEVADRLKQTSGSRTLQVEQNLLNSPVHQYLDHLVRQDPAWNHKFLNTKINLDSLVDSFMAWRVAEGFTEFSSADVKQMMKDNFIIEWYSKREGGKVVRRQRIVEPKPDVVLLLEQLKGDEDADTGTVVEDG